jgi:large subunit ribosomal protein L18
MDKRTSRLRRAKKTRMHIRRLREHSLCVSRTPSHISAYILGPDGTKTIVSATTKGENVAGIKGHKGNVEAAKVIGKAIAQRALEKKITVVAFDRAGYKYHGRVAALADAAREAGLKF